MTQKRYTKAELKFINSDLSDELVAAHIGRTTMAVYCKRWSLKQKPSTRRKKQTVTDTVVKKITEKQINQIVFGNVTITIKDKSLIINM